MGALSSACGVSVDTLLALGCRKMQGYPFSRPLAEPEFLGWLESHRSRKLAENVSI
ncbi:MAG: hypothetical protein ACXWAC_04535 [Usitatibacter sp.]